MEREEHDHHDVENWRRAQYKADYGHLADTTWEDNIDFPFKQGLLTRGRARFKHGGDVDGEF
jgi:hypothetical protein